MNPDENGYLARHLQSQLYMHYYNYAPIFQYGYNYGLDQIFMPNVPNSTTNIHVHPLQNSLAIGIESNLAKQQIPKKKRLTKRLLLIDIRKEFAQKSKFCKNLKKPLNYLDPCRAPPITTLRNAAQLEYDYRQELKKQIIFSDKKFPNQSKSEITLRKLQILNKAPDQQNYPFLICKKRKYYRKLKRRYSVTYFQQRAYYISHKTPIPYRLQPKHRNRKIRLKPISQDDQFHSSSDPSSNSNSEYIFSSESYDQIQKLQNLSEIDENPSGIEKVPTEVKEEILVPGQINSF